MSRALNDLKEPMRAKAFELLARCTEAGIQVCITCTGRTQAEQDEAVQLRRSKVSHSRHQDGMAIDICPYEIWQEHGDDKLQWNTKDPIWLKIRDLVKSLGLRSGADFEPLNEIGIGWDPGHAEIPAASSTVPV